VAHEPPGASCTTGDPGHTFDRRLQHQLHLSTKIDAGDGVLIDVQKMGRAAICEVIGLRIGYGVVGGVSDFTSNILRSVVEERLNLAVGRPSAICWVKNLPLS
jgi:hypothetical protein